MKTFIFCFISLMSIIRCHEYPYNGKIICKNSDINCHYFKTENNLSLIANNCAYTSKKNKILFGVFCHLKNEMNDNLKFDRNKFKVYSKNGLYFKAQPYYKANEWDKVKAMSDTFSIPPGKDINYIFSFSTERKYTISEMKQIIKSDTLSFVYTTSKKRDTLFRSIVADERVN